MWSNDFIFEKVDYSSVKDVQTVTTNTQNVEYFSQELFLWNLLENKSWITKVTTGISMLLVLESVKYIITCKTKQNEPLKGKIRADNDCTIWQWGESGNNSCRNKFKTISGNHNCWDSIKFVSLRLLYSK